MPYPSKIEAFLYCPSGRARVCRYLIWLCLVAVGFGSPLCADTTYSYTGSPFTSVQPPNSLGDRITGSFSVAIPLPAFMPMTDISGLVTSYQFSDGQQTRIPSDSVECLFLVSTDGEGHIVDWLLSFRDVGVSPGNPSQIMDVTPLGDQVGTGPAPVLSCDTINLTSASTNNTGGSWMDPLPSGTPTTYTFSGAPFSSADPPYTLGMRTAGWFRVDNPLPALLPLTDITQALVDFSFADDIQSRIPANTKVCRFEVATDAAGHLIDWTLMLRQGQVAPGNPQQVLDSSSDGDSVGSGNAGVGPCDPLINLTFSASTQVAGSWTDPLPPGDSTTYDYQGPPFSEVIAPYQLDDFISGFLRFTHPLPPYLNGVNLSFATTDFSFEDGIQMRLPTNSAICKFVLFTDGNGHIMKWAISLREIPFSSGQPQGFLDTTTTLDQGGSANADTGVCDPLTPNFFGFTENGGTWSDSLPPTLPVVYFYSGSPFVSATQAGLVGGKLSGRLTLPGALPALLPLTDISEHLLGLHFNDTLETRNLANSLRCKVEVSTDDNGQIVQWRLSLRNPVANQGDPQHSITSNGLGLLNFDLVGQGVAGADSCSRLPLPLNALSSQKGSWTQFCPAQLAALPQWPDPNNILDLLQINCP